MNNQPAFPHDYKSIHEMVHQHRGMTLRDYFAAKAMNYFMGQLSAWPSVDEVAAKSYQMADAMLKERDKRNESKNSGNGSYFNPNIGG